MHYSSEPFLVKSIDVYVFLQESLCKLLIFLSRIHLGCIMILLSSSYLRILSVSGLCFGLTSSWMVFLLVIKFR